MRIRALPTFALLSASLLPSIAVAQQERAPNVVYKPVTEIEFREQEIEGELVRPQVTLISDIKRESFNFITLRWDFNEEMTQSVEEVK